jgi:hypothetical protein
MSSVRPTPVQHPPEGRKLTEKLLQNTVELKAKKNLGAEDRQAIVVERATYIQVAS